MIKKVRLAEEEYNKIAQGYTDATKRPMRKFAYEPTVVNYIKEEIKDSKILDLACGEGVSTRLFKSLDAETVLGLDISQDLINIAKKTPESNIDYAVSDVFSDDLSKYGEFDIVTAIMLIHYAGSKSEIVNLLNKVKSCLKSGGLFYLLTINPKLAQTGYSAYGINLSGAKNEGESFETTLSDFEGNKFCSFTNTFWKQETYNQLFDEAGFNLEWFPGIVSSEGIKEYGEEFWVEYLKNPVYTVIKAYKINS